MNIPKRTNAERACDFASVAVAVVGFNSVDMAVIYAVLMLLAASMIFHWDWIFE
jgi:hypothetical protein